MHKIKLLTIPAFVVAIGISSAALAQYGDSPGRAQANQPSASQPASEQVGQYVDDATITAKVKAALFSDSQLKAMNVSVQTNQGTVQLSGMVDNSAQKSEAEKVANRVDGVKSVQDLLKVRSTQEE